MRPFKWSVIWSVNVTIISPYTFKNCQHHYHPEKSLPLQNCQHVKCERLRFMPGSEAQQHGIP